MLKTRKLIHEQRNKMEAALEKLGYIVYPSQANYIFFKERILQEAAVKSTEQEKKNRSGAEKCRERDSWVV